ncbi:MAG TPA: glycosyltransferase [Candidatus Tectomicrobia bacterium]|nr:glycosyltransferase [Candidatus Tectomicrobia bacterium]
MSWADLAVELLVGYSHVVLLYFVAINTQYLVLMLLGFRATLAALAPTQWQDLRRLMRSPLTPPVSIIAPAYNEAVNVAETVRSLLMLHYPQIEVVVVNDGSTDDTLAVLRERFTLRPVSRGADLAVPCAPIRAIYESAEFPQLVVVDKDNGGKADAVNAGLNVALYPLVCIVDTDSILEDDALLRVVRPFVDQPGVTVATGGIVRIANGSTIRAGRVVEAAVSRRLLPRIQVVEYLRGFLFGRMGWSAVNGLMIISGAFGLFDRQALIEAGGLATDTVGEDLEVVVRMHRRLREAGRPYRLAFVPDPVCWTEAPETWAALGAQRNRWHRGLLETLRRHAGMWGRPRYGAVGLLAGPCFILFEFLGPIIELSGYVLVPIGYALGELDRAFVLAFLAVSLLYGTLISVAAVLLEDLAFRRYPRLGDLARLLTAALVENLGYRQVTTWWRTRALWDYWRGRTGWGHVPRRGFGRA